MANLDVTCVLSTKPFQCKSDDVCTPLCSLLVDSSGELRLVVQALRLNTLSKLTFADTKRFDSLVRDVFPGVPFQDVEYVELEAALREVCAESSLVVIESQVRGKGGRGEMREGEENHYMFLVVHFKLYIVSD